MTNMTITSRENNLEIIEEASLQLPALKRPTLEEARANGWMIDRIERDNSTEEPVTITIVTVFHKPSRVVTKMNVRPVEELGYQHRQWLWEHRDEYPEFIERLKKLGYCGIRFAGIVVGHYDGLKWTRRMPGIYHRHDSSGRWEPGSIILPDYPPFGSSS